MMQMLELTRNGYQAAIDAYPVGKGNNTIFDFHAKINGIDAIINDLQVNHGVKAVKDIVKPNTVMENMLDKTRGRK